ncbi:MAG: fibrobacter succinogenes major paralogous domain-containing protein [Bacteroidales bacterium]|nr:fibrobacter succinogenes major paralogous domain-containing protein [Bacteroidales bacterium]
MKKLLIFIALIAQMVLFSTCDKELNRSKFPTVTTATPAIENGKIMVGGEVTDDGGSEITDKGVCVKDLNAHFYTSWENERLDLDWCMESFSAGPGKGVFSLETSLPEGEYKVRAYAVNKKGVAYGEIVTFTQGSLPSFRAFTVSGISPTSATATAIVQGTDISERGFCWSTSSNPTVNDHFIKVGSGQGDYSSNLTNLQPNTQYYVRAYAKNTYGVCYSNEVNFVTYQACPSTVNDYEGNTYNVVAIGSQCWMKENLKTAHFNNGTSIPLVQDSTAWSNRTAPAYCYYDKSSYGNLYNFYAVATGNLCPSGWHVPSYNEVFTTLYNALDASNVGGKMKVTGTTYWMSPNTGATNSSGFSARGGGYRPNGYGFDDIRKSAVFWTTSTYNSDFTYDFMMSYDAGELYRYGSSSYDYSISKKSGLSVRCVKNNSKDTYEDSNIPATPAKSREARH